jgi:hypothetical protein
MGGVFGCATDWIGRFLRGRRLRAIPIISKGGVKGRKSEEWGFREVQVCYSIPRGFEWYRSLGYRLP